MAKLGSSGGYQAGNVATPMSEYVKGYRGEKRSREIETAQLVCDAGFNDLDITQLTPFQRGQIAAYGMKTLENAVQMANGTGCSSVDIVFDQAKRIFEKLGNYKTSNRVGTLVLKRLVNYIESGYASNKPRTREEVNEFANYAGIPQDFVDSELSRAERNHKSSRKSEAQRYPRW